MLLILLAISPLVNATEDKREIRPVNVKWNNEEDPNRSLPCAPSLFRDASYAYVYSEKQLDNLTIGIIDMQGNTYYYEVTTIPACTYYAIPIESFPTGQYYIWVYQENNYLIGQFNK